MKAAVYSPYLSTLGGGERYIVSVAKVLADKGWSVYLESKDLTILDRLKDKFGLSLDDIKVQENIKRGDGYDLCFWLSDGSIPTLFARRNFLHFQRPFYNVDGRSLINRMKFFRIEKVIVNSLFTKSWIDKEFPKESIVVYPPVDVAKIKSGRKENVILSVGRFSQLEQSKRQDVLVDAFKKLYDDGYHDWKLVLAGGTEVGRTGYVDKLISGSRGYPITVAENPSFKMLKKLYANAKIFWTASGFGIEEDKNPEKVEHFGMAVVEGMAAGAVPLAYAGGGHWEIVKDSENGYLWKTVSQLVRKTSYLIDRKKKLVGFSSNSKKDSKKFSYQRFEEELSKLI